jgi:hypothetical protein
MRARRREKGERRIGVHGAVFSHELGWDSGEQFLLRGSLPREAEASAGCARERRSTEQDEEAGGELGWPQRTTLVRSYAAVAEESRSAALLLWWSEGREWEVSQGANAVQRE